jgi:hypothetical protein
LYHQRHLHTLQEQQDYTTTAGSKCQTAVTEKLSIKFDLNKEHLFDFLEAIQSRAIVCRWYDTLFMGNQAGVNINFVENYGTVTMASVHAKALTYMFSNTPQVQDTFNLYMCLKALLSTEARIAAYVESNTYTFTRGQVQLQSGIQPNSFGTP